MLSDSDDNDDITQFTINEHYAKAFQYKKEREELAKREFAAISVPWSYACSEHPKTLLSHHTHIHRC